jgi:hypothetical protein
VRKQGRLSDDPIMREVDAQVRKHAGSTRDNTWKLVLKSHEGQPDFGQVYDCYRRWHRLATADEVAKALVEETPLPKRSAEELRKMVRDMPEPAVQPWKPFWFTR